ncbi:hypothetical protein ES689_10665 [Frigoribacterium sp. ACAM 257]|uniref:hypothetical protein n=1 Tax=Frigoribacterium sp. ACAM 257 TaxID=2508998 RepID=UPI0011B9D114|nr:hypothetical protein [Frigoribacterium sp. ACAM 257]TWX37136.1 hypothetical protein ES689_10665 [Frigoribacterium sp. ACAM 257]
MTKPRDHHDHESHAYGRAHAIRDRGETQWRVSFAGGYKGTVHEVGGLFHATYLGHVGEADLGGYPSLDDAIDALMDED